MKKAVLFLSLLSTPVYANCFQTSDCIEILADCEALDRGTDGWDNWVGLFTFKIYREITCVTERGREVVWEQGQPQKITNPTREKKADALRECRVHAAPYKVAYKVCKK